MELTPEEKKQLAQILSGLATTNYVSPAQYAEVVQPLLVKLVKEDKPKKD